MNRFSVAAAWVTGGVVWGMALLALCLVARPAPRDSAALNGRLAEPQVARMLEQERQWISSALPELPAPPDTVDADDMVTTPNGSGHPQSGPNEGPGA